MTKSDAEQVEPMKLIFNYNNVFYSFYYDDLGGCIHRSREYAINYVYSGEMILDNGKEQIHGSEKACEFHRLGQFYHIRIKFWSIDGYSPLSQFAIHLT